MGPDLSKSSLFLAISRAEVCRVSPATLCQGTGFMEGIFLLRNMARGSVSILLPQYRTLKSSYVFPQISSQYHGSTRALFPLHTLVCLGRSEMLSFPMKPVEMRESRASREAQVQRFSKGQISPPQLGYGS